MCQFALISMYHFVFKVIPVSIVVYWMMIFWLKQSDTCVNGDLLNDDILIKIKWFLTNVSIVVYWMMIFWLKQSDTCGNSGLLNDDTLIKTKWYLCQWWFIEWCHHSISHHWHRCHFVLISRYHFVLIKISSFNKPPLTQISLCFNQNIIIQ
jgi:hypothetical protein